MGHEESLIRISGLFNASETLNQYKGVVRGAGTGYYQIAATGGHIDGVLQDDPISTGFVGQIGIAGVSKVLIGSAGCTDGDELSVDSTGAFVTQTSSAVGVGTALGTYASGDIGTMIVKNRGIH